MSYEPSTNPYQAPPYVAAPNRQRELDLFRSYTFLFENPNWMMNVLLTTVCHLIPVIGGLVVLGYQMEVAISLNTRTTPHYADFNFDRFVEYLKRGLWPFLLSLICAAIFSVLGVVVFVPMMVLLEVISQQGGQGAGMFVAIVTVLLAAAAILLFAAVTTFLLPMFLRAGLMMDFSAALDFGFAKDFARRVWKEMLIAMVFMMVSSTIVVMLGMMAFCVGIYPAIAVIVLAQAHLFFFQMYEIYLSRGGKPIAIKMPEATPAAGQ